MKAVILAAGDGVRFNGGIGTTKCLMPIQGRALIEFSLLNAVSLDIDEIILVVGRFASAIRDVVGDRYHEIPVRYTIQAAATGIIDALICAQDLVQSSDFAVFLGDELLTDTAHSRMVEALFKDNAIAICGTVPTENSSLVCKNYSLKIDPQTDRVLELVEKPNIPFNQLIGTGNCAFRNSILDYLPRTQYDSRTGRRELVGLIQAAIDDSQRVGYHIFENARYVNVNTAADLASAEHMTAIGIAE